MGAALCEEPPVGKRVAWVELLPIGAIRIWRIPIGGSAGASPSRKSPAASKMSRYRLARCANDPCRLVRQVKEIPWLDTDRNARQTPTTSCGR